MVLRSQLSPIHSILISFASICVSVHEAFMAPQLVFSLHLSIRQRIFNIIENLFYLLQQNLRHYNIIIDFPNDSIENSKSFKRILLSEPQKIFNNHLTMHPAASDREWCFLSNLTNQWLLDSKISDNLNLRWNFMNDDQ